MLWWLFAVIVGCQLHLVVQGNELDALDLFAFHQYEIPRMRWGELNQRGAYETSGKILKYKKQQTSLGEIEVPVNDNDALDQLSINEIASVLNINGLKIDFDEREPMLALDLAQEGEAEEALVIMKSYLTQCQEDAGKQHPVYANALADMAFILYKLNRYKESLEYLDQAMEIDSKNTNVYGKRNYASTANFMGIVGTAAGSEFTLISDAYEEAFKALELEGDMSRIKVLINLAQLYQSRGLVIRATGLWKMAKSILDHESPFLLEVHVYLAKTYMIRDEFTSAEKILENARKQLYKSPRQNLLFECMFSLATVNIQLGNLDRASVMLMELKDQLIEKFTSENYHVALVVGALGEVLLKQNNYEKAVMFLESAQSIAYGDSTTPRAALLRISHFLARSYTEAGFEIKAQPLLEDVIKMGKEVLGEEHNLVEEHKVALLLLRK